MEQVAAAAVVDTRGVVTGWSEGARRLTGRRAEEAVGRSARDLLAEPLPPRVLRSLIGTVLLRHRDGSAVSVRIRGCPLQGADGTPYAYAVTAEPSAGTGPSAGHEPTLAGQAFQQASMSMSVFDTRQRYLRLNDATCQVLGVDQEDLLGRHYADTAEDTEHSQGLLGHLREVARTGCPVRYESFVRAPTGLREHAWNIEMWPVRDARDELTGVGLAAFDSTDQYWARQRLALLNEAATTIGTTLDVVRTAEELVSLVTPRFADFVSVDLLEWVLGADEPPAAAPEEIVLRRVAHGSSHQGTPEASVRLGETDLYPPYSPPARALREGRPVLSGAGDPGFDRWVAERDAHAPEGSSYREGAHSLLAVPLRARGTILGVAVAVRITQPRPYADDDAALAEELASRAAVCVDNARRFARERTTALVLQHSLLPRGLPGQAAVDVAHRYLPCGSLAGIGGDWFDVIPLSGSRVALVVGDVVGHGIPSTATMGRLCMAVRTLADVDLAPDELLTHLDDLVTHLAANGDGGEVAELGATCLYAVYDPVDRSLRLAAAGHPAPAVVLPDGTAHLVPMSAGPPLGVGGLPFEAAELQLPEGSVVALYTDGLVENRDQDVDQATEELRRALTTPTENLDTLCDRVLKAVLPEEPADDVALLLARTRALGADRVATWDVPPDPAHVAATRQAATEQLAAWGLEDAAFVTELVVSELVTNAIRYGAPPIQLRLIRDRALICEVSDGSSTSPHLRRAHAFDEGGRGLLLVAQLTQRWGSRQTTGGKTIWAEQPLPE
ncbi:SpoIIE family protein phosphatase [Streptomyces actuosus]|uniref:SpoIIE family protein phosphatase n=1 Tax=Streptomyces actuosus TaxID=1885 RepID=A0ABS2VU99_STRAS|nr:SpoIIE family protein phosphatase [Streptomyces actuosus]MBN0046707.1 SpoIIE family protein phosphatase [Streptomyces actuosus]